MTNIKKDEGKVVSKQEVKVTNTNMKTNNIKWNQKTKSKIDEDDDLFGDSDEDDLETRIKRE